MATVKQEITLMSLREAAGLTQVDLACRMGVTDHTIRNWEKFRTRPSHDQLLELARELNQPLRAIYASLGFDVSGIPLDSETQSA